MNPLCAALKKSAENFWQQAMAVKKSDPELAAALKHLAKSAAKEADEIANRSGIKGKKILAGMGKRPN
jgi:monomeric isocitrate dehydrogenase